LPAKRLAATRAKTVGSLRTGRVLCGSALPKANRRGWDSSTRPRFPATLWRRSPARHA